MDDSDDIDIDTRKRSIPFSESEAKKQVEKLAKGTNKTAFHGIAELTKAIQNGLVQEGNLIFGTSSIVHAKGLDRNLANKKDKTQTERCQKDDWKAAFMNTFPSMMIFLGTRQWRKYPYLHVAIYAGHRIKCSNCELFHGELSFTDGEPVFSCDSEESDRPFKCPKCSTVESLDKGKHYVIEVGGHYHGGIGMVSAKPLEDAFMNDAEFIAFIPHPPGQKSLTMVLQRALACLGLYFYYDMAAVSCEIFALTIMKMVHNFGPIQLEVLNLKKGMSSPEIDKFDKFYVEITKRLKKIDTRNMLTLEYYLNNVDQEELISRIKSGLQQGYTAFELNNADPWFLDTMYKDYDTYRRTNDPSLIHKGLVEDEADEQPFSYLWLNPEDKDAPAKLELHLKVEKDNLKVEKVTLDAIKALNLGFEEMFLVLFKKGNELKADWNTRDEGGWTALMHACQHGNEEATKMLLQVPNIDVNVQDQYGYTCLMAACTNCLSSPSNTVPLLLDWSSKLSLDLNHQDFLGQTAFNKVCSYNQFFEKNSPPWKRSIELVQLLIGKAQEKNIDLANEDHFGGTGFDCLPDSNIKKELARFLNRPYVHSTNNVPNGEIMDHYELWVNDDDD